MIYSIPKKRQKKIIKVAENRSAFYIEEYGIRLEAKQHYSMGWIVGHTGQIKSSDLTLKLEKLGYKFLKLR